MPKREAEAYITKEHGSTVNNPVDAEKPKMSTAAQQARRKIATPKGRLGASRAHSSLNTTNPFGQSTQQPSFPTMNGSNGSTTFGTSQSFPPTAPGTNGGFNFQPPQSSSFTFGAPSSTPNPFASLNGTGDGGSNQQQDISMESPQKKAAVGNAFGSSNTNSGFSFGQPTQQQNGGGFSFGGNKTSDASTNGGGLFGKVSDAAESSAPANPFGASSQPAFGGFGAPAQTQTSSFSFGQSTTTPAAAPPTPSFSFGQSSTTSQTPLPAFSFGQSSTTQPEPPKETPKFAFGETATTSQNQPSAPSFSFGTPAPSQPSTTFSLGQTQQSTAPSTPFPGFGAKSAETKPTSSLFGSSAATPQPATNEQRSQSPEKPAASESEQPPPNPFAGLFANSTSASPAPISKPAFSFGTSSTSTSAGTNKEGQLSTTPSKPAFSFGTKTEPSTSVAGTTEPKAANAGPSFSFGAKTTLPEPIPSTPESPAPADKPTEGDRNEEKEDTTTPAKPMFGFAASAQPVSSGGLFSPAKKTAVTEDRAQPKELFGLSKPTAEPSAKPAFGGFSKPTSTTESSKPLSEATPAQKPLFGATPQQEARVAEVGAKSSLFGQSTTAPASSNEKSKEATAALEPSKQRVYTKASSSMPSHLTAEKYQEYDRDYRLHSLNRELQQRIAQLDPDLHDFGNIIRHYVAARDGIGASLGLYKRSVAGTKRKGDDLDHHDEEHTSNKRPRSDASEQARPPQSNAASQSFAASSTPGPSDHKAASSTLFTPKTTDSSAKATALFNTMIPQSAPAKATQPTAGFKPSGNPFAGLTSASSAPPNPFAAMKETQGAGSASIPEPSFSTTPTKSPPKKPTFEVPKFGGGNTNFMSAFGQQAKANAKKFEKNLIEKRKAEDFDSDEDDEETFQKQMEEEARAKRAKIDAIAKGGFTPSFKPTTNSTPSQPSFKSGTPPETQSAFSGFKPAATNPFAALTSADTSADQSQAEDEDEGEEDSGSSEDEGDADQDAPEDEDLDTNVEDEDDDDDNDMQAAMAKSRKNASAGKSLFDRIEPKPTKQETTPTAEEKKETAANEDAILQSAKNSSFPPAVWGSHIGKSTPETPSFSPITPATGSYKPSTTFTFTPTPPTASPSATPGASIFAGGLIKGGPVPGEGLFGSRPSTPSNAEKSGILSRSVLTSPAGTDNTWKQGGPISFANGENKQDAPAFSFTAPSPGKGSSTPKPFGSLFGTPAPGAKGTDTPTLGFQFGAPTPNPAPGYLGAITHLGGGSAASSTVSSRATSPGLTDNESNATNDTEETNDDPQTSLMDSRTGEENETCLWEGRSKALMYVNKEIAQGTKLTPNDWNSMGVGVLRVLQDKTTAKTRVVFRVEPSASVLINSHIIDSVTYENVVSNKSGAVRGALFYKGNLARWVFKVKTPEMATELSTILEENKKSA
ncbi:hypothetical protein LTR93_004053 [Exophiala xenobiotica]|nr:hypothetical protein LTR93_004053 [Exophiala xenobiotica]